MHEDESFLKDFQEPPNPTRCTSINMVIMSVDNYSDDELIKKYMDLANKDIWDEICKNCKMPSLLHKGPCTRKQEAAAFASDKILEERDKFTDRMRQIRKDIDDQEKMKNAETGQSDLLKGLA